jgi:predicted amidohydrolase
LLKVDVSSQVVGEGLAVGDLEVEYRQPDRGAALLTEMTPTVTPITLLPEFHLTGFSQDNALTRSQAAEMASSLPGVVVAGYVEKHGSSFYSSAIVVDENGSVYNVRKSEPWGRKEKSWLTGSHCAPPILELSIGKTIVIICRDAFETHYGARKVAQAEWGSRGIDWVLVPSHWKSGIHKLLIKRGVWRLARAVGGAEWIVSDTYNGLIKSWEWEG